jgi:hypothetical protein
MRTGTLVGIVILYMVILGLEMMVTGGIDFTNNVTNSAGALLQPDVAASGNIATQTWAVISNIGSYVGAIFGAILLWSPTVFSGYMLWLYWFICFPIACAMIYAVITMIRGSA